MGVVVVVVVDVEDIKGTAGIYRSTCDKRQY